MNQENIDIQEKEIDSSNSEAEEENEIENSNLKKKILKILLLISCCYF